MLTPSQGRLLVSVARRSLEMSFESRPRASNCSPAANGFHSGGWDFGGMSGVLALKLRKEFMPKEEGELVRKCGVFVTLKRDGELRGCIGYVSGTKPLFDAVVECALLAAFGDPRFPPLQRAELPGLECEVSVLLEFTPVNGIGELVVGRHGLYVESRGRSGLLLPQVAAEQKWNVRQFVDGVYRKAGIVGGAGAKLSKFEAQVFSS